MSERNYMNQCPTCEAPFFCTDKRDFACPYCRIAQLEAQNRIFRSTESVDDSVWDALLEQVRNSQDQLAAVRALPDKWRDEDKYRDKHEAADELDAKLAGEEDAD
jgi:hypothetical protein